MFLYLSALVDFTNIFIRYEPKQSTSELSPPWFFSNKEYFYGTKISINLADICLKPAICMIFKFDAGFIFMFYFDLFG